MISCNSAESMCPTLNPIRNSRNRLSKGPDGRLHYLSAYHHAWERASEQQRISQWQFYQTPLFQYRPLPQARRFHQSQKLFRWALGGNRSSKSHSLAVETIWRATGWHPFQRVPVPSVGWYATTTVEKIADTLWAKLDPKKGGLLQGIDHEIVWRSKQWDIPGRVLIPVPGGKSEIIFKAFQQDRESFQAAELDYAHFDEQFPQSVFVETVTRIGPGKRLHFAAAMTPIESQPWLEKRLITDRLPTDDIFEFPLDDNRESLGGFIPDERIDALINEWPPEVRETRRLGKWGAYLGAIFQSFKRETHVVSEARERELFFLPGRGMQATVGVIDWGGSNPFGMIFACRVPHLDNDWYVYDEIFWDHRSKGGRRLADLASDIKAKLAQWKTHLTRCYADHDPTNVLEMRHCGIATTPAVKVGTQDEISRIGIEAIQKLLFPRDHLVSTHWPMGRPQLHIAARCENLIREMSLYRWAEVPEGSTRSPRNIPIKVDDHLVDCVRYLVATENRHSAKIIDIGDYARTFR